MKILIQLLACVMLIAKANAQLIKPLSIGDTVPDIVLHYIINYKADSVRLTDLKQPVIIDFFTTWCGNCIAALPHLDSLQKQFGDSIQIFVVSYESEEKIKAFLENNKVAKNIDLAFISNDILLRQLFPHRLIPHEIIISRGKVKAITYPEYITKEVLHLLPDINMLSIPLKKDIVGFNAKKMSLKEVCPNRDVIGNSIFTHYIKGLATQNGNYTDVEAGKKRIYFINNLILPLYLYAADINYNCYNRVVLDVKDLARYMWPPNDPMEWVNKNCYSYEISVCGTKTEKEIKQYMLQDLNSYLNIDARMEKRKVKCWALIRINNDSSRLKTKGERRKISLLGMSAVKTMSNAPLSELAIALNNQTPGYPLHPIILDETRYKGNVDLELKVNDIQDLPATAKALKPYGLELIPVERELDMLVITENDYPKNKQ